MKLRTDKCALKSFTPIHFDNQKGIYVSAVETGWGSYYHLMAFETTLEEAELEKSKWEDSGLIEILQEYFPHLIASYKFDFLDDRADIASLLEDISLTELTFVLENEIKKG